MSLEAPLSSVQTRATQGPAPGGLGRGLFASDNINIGEDVLHITSPFVAVLDTQRLGDTCSGCLGSYHLQQRSPTLNRCAGCKVVKYCNRACQTKDWKYIHSLECPIFNNLSPRILPSNARALLRIVLRSGRKRYSDEELDLFFQLETHIKEIRDQNPAQWERIALTSKAVKAYSGTDIKEELISTFGAKLELNSFNLTNAFYDRIGLYIHPYAAILNHNCNYNAVVGFEAEQLYIKAIRPIQKGEQIFISYIDTTNPVHIRRNQLRERFYFDCECPKCQQDHLSKPDDSPQTSHAQNLSALKSAEKDAYEFLHDCPAASDLDPKETAAKLQSYIRFLSQTYSWPVTRQPLVSLRDELIVSLLSASNNNSALVQSAIRYLRIDPIVYEDKRHPIRQQHAYTMAKVAHAAIAMNTDMTLLALVRPLLTLEPRLIAWSVLSRLVETQSEACTVPKLQCMIRSDFDDLNRWFAQHGMDPTKREDDIWNEWKKIELLVDAALGEGY
ncbi:S-adenosylmethionine-dependent methyltransferase [Aspergillus alliaceus]|uniref:S-adenosylmethionine-dependent methyltransferase n=1 Tax=Petromyces alliaceus TaxID=209559 RepID=UPI0012A5F9F0|nr:uncharacterized protein BDW43DRAFT_91586 [Aspergillus alliaceus]KAB8233323.1 hypothetical protein BDW43DRAFT_91586 [Aspergillus alliaceus]